MNKEPSRKFSLVRLLLFIIIVLAIFYYLPILKNINKDLSEKENNDLTNWFAPYVDVTATPRFEFEKLGKTSANNLFLSFIVASAKDNCKPTWGNAYDLDSAKIDLDLDRRIALLREQGGEVGVSFGGQLNSELALVCTDKDKLKSAYESVINQYGVRILDFDIEGEALNNLDSIKRRVEVIKEIQVAYKDKDDNIAVWLTIPVATTGLTDEGINIVNEFLKAGVDLSGINIMTMNYSVGLSEGKTLLDNTKEAITNTHRQLGILYNRNNTYLNERSIYKKLGVTPMIGQNDVFSEVFTLEDAILFNEYVFNLGIPRISMWSINRDVKCGDNYVNVKIVSDSCSGIEQQKFAFSDILSKNYKSSMINNRKFETKVDEKLEGDIVDDPKTSPYPIWNENNVYLQGSKVVWKKNVYQAKWWTKGDFPDNPVLQSWETPWTLIGPVLPNEKPIELPKLPANYYPKWNGNVSYDEGDRVIFNGVAYVAKWWNQGESPAASNQDPASSPWLPLTTKQLKQILEEIEKSNKHDTK